MIHPQAAYLQRVKETVSKSTYWLDLGCGRSIWPPWLSANDELGRALITQAGFVAGLDADIVALQSNRTLACRVMGDSAALPFRTESFDLVTSNMVFEHLVHPMETITEMIRVLRPGGRAIIHTANAGDIVSIVARMIPNSFHSQIVSRIEGRAAERVYPTQYRLNTKGRLQDALREAGFSQINVQLIESPDAYHYVPVVRRVENLWHMLARHIPQLRGTIIADGTK